MEMREFTYNGRGYKIISNPTITEDKYALIMVYMMETDKRQAHYRILQPESPKREMLRKYIVEKVRKEDGIA